MFSVLWMVDYDLYAETNFSLSHVVWEDNGDTVLEIESHLVSKFTKILGGYQARPVNLRFLIGLKNVLDHKITYIRSNLKPQISYPYSCF